MPPHETPPTKLKVRKFGHVAVHRGPVSYRDPSPTAQPNEAQAHTGVVGRSVKQPAKHTKQTDPLDPAARSRY